MGAAGVVLFAEPPLVLATAPAETFEDEVWPVPDEGHLAQSLPPTPKSKYVLIIGIVKQDYGQTHTSVNVMNKKL